MRDIDGLTLYFDFQCFTSHLLIGDENQFWAKIFWELSHNALEGIVRVHMESSLLECSTTFGLSTVYTRVANPHKTGWTFQ